MMKARACLGIYSKNAYYFERLELSVYCMEELAFCLKEYAFLIGTEIMTDRMLQFIGADCQVPELARELYPMVHQKGALSVFVTTILEYVGFFEQAVVRQVENTVRMGSGLTDYEKQKLQIDYLVEKKKYAAAVEAYKALILDMKDAGVNNPKEASVLADLYYNRGVVYTRMLFYKQAANDFQRSYELKRDRSTLQSFFFAKRLELSEQEYVNLVAQYPESYEITLEVEQRMEALEQQWKETHEYVGLKNMRKWRTVGDKYMYYEESVQIVDALKEEYRR
ncbi:MAG: hypothetical protein IJN16_11410 [Lachnospiraceae bacterium]|nr:hypothetical protein [Lachnospiraceae bacterium]